MSEIIREKNMYCENCANSYIAETISSNGHKTYIRKCPYNVALCLLEKQAHFKPIKKEASDTE